MVKGAAFGCRRGYDNEKPQSDSPKVSFHCVPWNDKELLAKWLHAHPRQDWTPSQYTRLCSLHFKPDDFVVERTDQQARRKRKFDSLKLPNRRLKDGVIPSIFAITPAYLVKTQTQPRKTCRAAPSTRREREAEEQTRLEQSFMVDDDLSQLSMTEINDKLRAAVTAPQGFVTLLENDQLILYIVTMDTRDLPFISASIVIRHNQSAVVTIKDKIVPASQYSYLIKGSLKTLSQLVILMALVKNWDQNSEELTEDT